MFSWRTRWKINEFRHNSIWIVPAIFAVAAIVAGIIMPALDNGTEATLGLSYGASAAQGILGAIAGGMITFTGFVFSILLLAVQFGSSQFSPRMLRRFLRDATTRISLGFFIATFIYALLVLRWIEPANQDTFIPDYSVTFSLILLLLSMAMFLRLISRTTQGLRVASVLQDLGNDGVKQLVEEYPEMADFDEDADRKLTLGESGAISVIHFDEASGIAQSLDVAGLVEMAEKADVVIELVQPIGDQIMVGDPLFRLHGDVDRTDHKLLRESIAISDERTVHQDPAFIFRLLADISSKALSPGVNDPTTAVQALDQIEMLLRILGRRTLNRGIVNGSGGKPRLVFPSPTWEDYLSIGLDETRIFGEGSIQVSRRLRALLEDLKVNVPVYRVPAIDAQLALLELSIQRSFNEEIDRTVARTPDRQGVGSPRPG